MRTLADVLPAQPHYYVLWNGVRYAQHGTENLNGLLVFTNLERAEQFVMTVGKGLPEFQPIQVTADKFLQMLLEHGGRLCMAHSSGVMVAMMMA